MNVDTIKNGLVIDHIRAGLAPRIFQWLGLDKAPFTSALIMNVQSKKTGKKDMIKVDTLGPAQSLQVDYSVLGFIDPDICVSIIENEKIVRKIHMELPSRVHDVFRCRNPRCITVTESYVRPTFILVDREKALYRCEYCDSLYVGRQEGEGIGVSNDSVL